MEKPVCNYCGSDEVFLDAWAYWDKQNQCWGLYNTFDYAYCNQCEGDTNINWIEDEPFSSNTTSQDIEITN